MESCICRMVLQLWCRCFCSNKWPRLHSYILILGYVLVYIFPQLGTVRAGLCPQYHNFLHSIPVRNYNPKQSGNSRSNNLDKPHTRYSFLLSIQPCRYTPQVLGIHHSLGHIPQHIQARHITRLDILGHRCIH